jgi:Putative zinc-finger
MDHSEAVRLKAAENYILGELPPDLREQFEEHYFDCTECAADVRALTAFVTATRMLGEEQSAAKAVREQSASHRTWFAWLRPVIAVPAMAALVALVVFQNAVTIPGLKREASAEQSAQVFVSSYHLQGTTRGENSSVVTLRSNEGFALDFDFTPTQTFESYDGSLVDDTGRAVTRFRVSGEQVNRELHLVIPAGKVHAGKYNLVFLGSNGTENTESSRTEVQRFSFVVEVQR